MDLTLRLGLPTPTVETTLSLNTLYSDQGSNIVNNARGNNNDSGEGGSNNEGGGVRLSLRQMLLGDDEVDEDEGARNNVNINIRVYNQVFQQFTGTGETSNFAPYPMTLSLAPAPVTPPVNDYVLLDVPARRAHRNNVMAMGNAWNAEANVRRFRGCSGLCGGRIEGVKRCTNKNCNAFNTPMWRRGPLGPKSLCNACGIKFRKEEERRSKR